MPPVEDISWHMLRRIVHEWHGDSAELDEVKPLVGGSINNTVALHTTDGSRAVLKISPHRVNRDFEREANQLRLLRQIGLPAPEVYHVHPGDLEHPFGYLLMEYREGVCLNEARQLCTPEQFDRLQERLAELVCALHDRTSDVYERVGLSNGEARSFENWPAFYRHVYDAIWHEAEKDPHLPVKCRKQIDKVHERLERLVAHDDRPRLVHWDIWATNLLVKPDAEGEWQVTALLDPNCKFAHAEAEIAYLELFHTVTPAFMRAYRRRHRLPPAYERIRRPIYQLYPLINHLRLFGAEYVRPLTAAVERVAAVV
jgi:fructosamine-3-kinase